MWGRSRKKSPVCIADREGLRMLCELVGVYVYGRGRPEDPLARDFEPLLAAVRRGEQIIDQTRELAERLRVPDGVRWHGADLVPLPGVPDRPGVEVYGCPTRDCDRRWVRRPDRAIPTCAINGQSLARYPRP